MLVGSAVAPAQTREDAPPGMVWIEAGEFTMGSDDEDAVQVATQIESFGGIAEAAPNPSNALSVTGSIVQYQTNRAGTLSDPTIDPTFTGFNVGLVDRYQGEFTRDHRFAGM